MEIVHIKGDTFCINTGMTYIPFYKINDKEIIMLDTGWKNGEREGIEKLLEENSYKVAAILNSHAHIDHIGNNAYFKDKYNCIIAMSDYESLICSSAVNLKLYYCTQTLKSVEQHYGHMICKTDIIIEKDQNVVNIRGIDFKIIHTPGHSPAHICIITPDEVAYLGDALISYEVMNGAKMPYAFILSEDLKSKAKLLALDCEKYVVAHKGIYDNITKLIDDNIIFYKDKAAQIYEVIDGAMTKEDILKAVIKRLNIHVSNVFRYAVIERMLNSYVEYLFETEQLKLIMESGFLKYTK